MFQTFEETSHPEFGADRLAALRAQLAAAGLAGFIVPRADLHQGEYVAPADQRLQWLTGFTGSAGFCIVLPDVAGVFIDGRYRTQVRQQVDLGHFTPVPWPDVKPADWLIEHMPEGGTVGFDPWLHTAREIGDMEKQLSDKGIDLVATTNPIDRIWSDRPAPPMGRVTIQPLELAGENHADKRARMAAILREAGQRAAVLTLPDSIAWLLNIRGTDVPRNPVVHALGILGDDGTLQLFIAPEKLDAEVRAHLTGGVTLRSPADLIAALDRLEGPVRIDRSSAPMEISRRLAATGIEVAWGQDPCLLPKACKNAAEAAGMIETHLTDGAAMAEFLAWFDRSAPGGGLTEIDAVKALEGFRRATNQLKDISFETICGSGPNGAVIHYRVTDRTNQRMQAGEVVVIDSGGQYQTGTTDITRTVAVGAPGKEERTAFTRVLRGMIAISRLIWPRGLAGAHLDAIARYPLWLAHQDYDHGTGHGVGAYLSVHEGPAGLARRYDVPFEAGMILSNEPGYYRPGAFGIRIENLVMVEPAPVPEGGDAEREMLRMRTLTLAPIDRRLIDRPAMSADEIAWLDAYHAEVLGRIGPRVSSTTLDWLTAACAPL